MHLIIRFIVNAVALYCIAKYVPGFNHDITVTSALIAAVIFGVVNAILGPILRLISLPITFITLGLFSIVINFILFAIVVKVSPGFYTTVSNWWEPDLIGAIIMMIVSTIMHSVTRSEPATSR
jgi:putative membrane protein